MCIRDRRHSAAKAPRGDIREYQGNCYLGIDAGSTTTKAVVIGENDEILYSWYASNFGSPFHSALKILNDIYRLLPEHAKIAFSAVTGYGEGLIKTALGIDIGEIETIAHYKAAEKAEKACMALLKLFDLYAPLKETEAVAQRSDAELTAYKKAQTLRFIAKITKRVYDKNEKEIRSITAQIEELSSGLERGLLDVDATASEQAVYVKKLLSRARRARSKVKAQWDLLCLLYTSPSPRDS